MPKDKSPAFQFYPRDFLADGSVSMMTYAERGVYITLLCHDWNDGGIPPDIDSLSKLLKIPTKKLEVTWKIVGKCFMPMHEHSMNKLTNPRLNKERKKQYKRSEESRASAEKRWKSERKRRLGKSNIALPSHPVGIDSVMPTQCSAFASAFNTPIVPKGTMYTDDFERFWSAYPRKVGKGAAGSVWNRIAPNKELASTIIASVEAHAKSNDWTKEHGQFIPHPRTYLHQRRWEDDVSGNGSHPKRTGTHTVFNGELMTWAEFDSKGLK